MGMTKLFLYAAIMVAMIGVVSAAATITVNCPSSSDYIKGVMSSGSCEGHTNQRLNVSVSGVDSANNITNLTFYYTPSGGTATLIGYNSSTDVSTTEATMNVTHAAGGYSVSFNTLPLQDVLSYTLTVYGGNSSNSADATNKIATGTVTVSVDNSVPTSSLSSGQSSNTRYSNTDTWTYSANNASSCTLYFDGNSYAGTISGSANAQICSFSDSIPAMAYDEVYAVTSDGTNQTTSAKLSYVIIEDGGSGGGGASVSSTTQSSGGQLMAITDIFSGEGGKTNLLWALLIIGVVWWLWKK